MVFCCLLVCRSDRHEVRRREVSPSASGELRWQFGARAKRDERQRSHSTDDSHERGHHHKRHHRRRSIAPHGALDLGQDEHIHADDAVETKRKSRISKVRDWL